MSHWNPSIELSYALLIKPYRRPQSFLLLLNWSLVKVEKSSRIVGQSPLISYSLVQNKAHRLQRTQVLKIIPPHLKVSIPFLLLARQIFLGRFSITILKSKGERGSCCRDPSYYRTPPWVHYISTKTENVTILKHLHSKMITPPENQKNSRAINMVLQLKSRTPQ